MSTLQSLGLWYDVSSTAMKDLNYELSMRQTCILLKVYLEDGPHTVKSLSAELNISKAAVCRALDKLSIAKLLKRRKDTKDRRNVFIQRTMHGSVFLSDFAEVIDASLKKKGSELTEKKAVESAE